FDSLEEAFGENAKHIYAMETGLSADPAIIWRIPDGRKMTLISNSDAHSSSKLGREVNVFDTELSYSAIRDAIIKKDKSKFLHTIEFFPQEGKYYYDGHRSCNVSMSPKQRKKTEGICPKCGRKLTVGVLSRVDELADRKDSFVPSDAIPYKSLVPLKEIIAEAIGIGPKTKGVDKQYQILIQKFSNEFNILLDVSFEELSKFTLPRIAEGIKRVRSGKLIIEPGYDGEFGKVKIFQEKEKKIR
ncbi:MAG TPA: endonuclease Q family protein, partial [Candidatus Paceibacterota bacterium]|nr:endonuclease Q family protein [Candidatus Paceibacterota bacterium]